MVARRLLLAVLLLGWCATAAQSAVTLQESLGSATTLLSTELNSIGSNSYTNASAIYDNSIGAAGNGALRCRLELLVVYGTTPTANTAWVVWLSRSADGTNYEPTPSATVGPGTAFAVSFPVNSGQLTTRGVVDIDCPAGKFKATAKNDGTGQAAAASGNTLKIWPIILQGN
jgi:hypothetical protein